MAESTALLVDEILPHESMRQLLTYMACSRAMQEQVPRVLNFPYQLMFLFASRPELMGKVLGTVPLWAYGNFRKPDLREIYLIPEAVL